MKPDRTIPLTKPFLGLQELENLKEVLNSGWLTEGRYVRDFEDAFAQLHHVKHAIAVTSATSGLHLSLVALGIGPGDDVILPSFSWIATANVVEHVGARPVFCDVDPETYNLTADSVLQAMTHKTRALIAVHLFGLPAPIAEISAVLPTSVAIVEDAACAVGALAPNRPVGGLGRMGVFSFHPRKAITTGEGGMISTDDEQLADAIYKLRNHGAMMLPVGSGPADMPDFPIAGYNARMTDLQAAVGLPQLKNFQALWEERNEIACRYIDALAGIKWLSTPVIPEHGRHSWQAFVVKVSEERSGAPRNGVMRDLAAAGISTRPGTHAIHTLSYYRDKYTIRSGNFPEALACAERTIALPMFNGMGKDDVNAVIKALKNF